MAARAVIRRTPGLVVLVTLACGNPPGAVVARGEADCTYQASVKQDHGLLVDVRCRGATPAGFKAEPGVARYVSRISTPSGVPLEFEGDTVHLGSEGSGLRYRVDLGTMARETRDFDHALSVGDSIIAPGYSWLLSPTEVPDDLTVNVRVSGPDSLQRFVSGLAADGPGYTLRANEIRVATYGVFGAFDEDTVKLESIRGATARLDLVTLDGPLAVGPSVRRRWVLETAGAVSDFYGGFPCDRALLAIVPVAGRGSVLHGKVLPESNPGVALLLGSDAGAADLYADWILTHELFHLGFPSFSNEGKWLDEGLATYFEPLIRARKHWLSEREVWAQFLKYMPRGRAVLERDGLENPSDYRGMYWAGATVALMADVEALRRSQGVRGLQHGLRALLRAGGEASRVWRLEDAIERIDTTLGAPVLGNLARRYTRSGQRVELSRLFDELGVRKNGTSVSLDDAAPLAEVRKAITRGAD